MNTVEQLFSAFTAEYRAGGEADPHSYLERASAEGRMELAAMIDHYLAQAPRAPFEPERFAGSSAVAAVDALERVILGQSGSWPALLPRLRHRARLKRADLVERLAAELGVSAKREKVADYYNQMEQGMLPAHGVSSSVLEVLGRLFGETAETLRAAGRPSGGAGGAAGPAFARVAQALGTPDYLRAESAPASRDERDEVDELFAGSG